MIHREREEDEDSDGDDHRLEDPSMITAKDEGLEGSAFSANWLLYAMHFFFAFSSRLWDMGSVLLIAQISHNSLALVALTGLVNNLFLVCLMGPIGRSLDRSDRLFAATVALIAKLVSLTLAYALCAYLSFLQSSHSAHTEPPPWVYVLLPVLCATASLAFNALSQSVEKDWVVVLAAERSAWLTHTNAALTQIDNAVNALSPALAGALLLSFSSTPAVAALLLLLVNALSTALLFVFLRYLYHSWPALSRERGTAGKDAMVSESTHALVDRDDDEEQENALHMHTTQSIESSQYFQCAQPEEKNVLPKPLTQRTHFFHAFLSSGCAGAMFAYACLFLTVLSYGSLMTVYLRWSGVDDASLGLLRGAAALAGFLGAFLFPAVQSACGLYVASAAAIVYQAVLVSVAAAMFFFLDNRKVVWILCLFVLLSRTGLWMFDLGVRQIAQETIPEDVRGVVNGQWRSMTAFFEMVSYILGLVVRDPKDFWILTLVSACMVVSAMVIFLASGPYHSHSEYLEIEMKSTSYKQYHTVARDNEVP